MSNFDFLRYEWRDLHRFAVTAEKYAIVEPFASVVSSRRALECAVFWMFENDEDYKNEAPYNQALNSFIQTPRFREDWNRIELQKIHYIRKAGNDGAHPNLVRRNQSIQSVKHLYDILLRFAQWYSDDDDLPNSVFVEDIVPTSLVTPEVEQKLIEQKLLIQKLEDERKLAEEKRIEAENEAKKYQAHIQKVAKQKYERKEQKIKPISSTSEAETRRSYIDLDLQQAGWDLDTFSVTTEHQLKYTKSTKSGRGFADYILWNDNGKPLAVIEAKNTLKSPKDGKMQAKEYADSLEKEFEQRPVIFLSNGYEHWIWDDAGYTDGGGYPERKVSGFYTKEELKSLFYRRKNRQNLKMVQPNTDILGGNGRAYQTFALRAVCEQLIPNPKQPTDLFSNRRKFLLVMATGSGKTRTAIGIVRALTDKKWIQRVLFLADRTALVNQAMNHFTNLLPDLPTINLLKDKEDTSAKLVFATYQTLMNEIDRRKQDGNSLAYGTGHFDLIIVDEAHRSIYAKYQAIFEHFDAMLLGLTATPKDEVDKNTYDIFQLPNNHPTFAYELREAIDDGFLVPPKTLSAPTQFQRSGIKYAELSEEEKADYEDNFFDEAEDTLPDKIDPKALNTWLFNKDSTRKILMYLIEKGIQIEGGEKIGKTIIFAKSHQHALFIQEVFNELYPNAKGEFIEVIDNYHKDAQNALDRFSTLEKMPQIAISVDMLDTGVDIPEVLNLVFYKPVFSKTKFWQMVGRGTRLCEDIFAPNDHKKEFLILDVCQNCEFFEFNPEGKITQTQRSLSHKIFNKRLLLAESLRPKDEDSSKKFRTELLDHLHAQVTDLDENSFIHKKYRTDIIRFKNRENWNFLSDDDLYILQENLGKLVKPDDGDEKAKRFDYMMHQMQDIIAKNDMQKFKKSVIDIRTLTHELQRKGNIPEVAQQNQLFEEILTEEFWQNPTPDKTEKIRLNLRGVLRFLDKTKAQKPIYTDYEDEIIEEGEKNILKIASLDLEGYRQRIERFIWENADKEPAIWKLRNNEVLTTGELQDLEQILFEQGDIQTLEQFQKELKTDKPLGKFVRSVTGMNREAIQKAFAQFITQGNLDEKQNAFLKLIVDNFEYYGIVESKDLFDLPYTQVHLDFLGLFGAKAYQLGAIIEEINQNAG